MIYIITEGRYDDYQVLGATTDREKAEAYIAALNDYEGYSAARIEEYDDLTVPEVFTEYSAEAWWNELSGEWKRSTPRTERRLWEPSTPETFVFDDNVKGRFLNSKAAERNEDGSWKYYRAITIRAVDSTVEAVVARLDKAVEELNV